MRPAAVAFQYSEWATSIGTLARPASSAAPIAAGTGLCLVSVPARATTRTAPAASTSQATPLIRLNSENEARMTATAAAAVRRWFIGLVLQGRSG